MHKEKGQVTGRPLSSILALSLLVCVAIACNRSRVIREPKLIYEGSTMTDAAQAFRKKLGGPFKALAVEIDSTSVTLRAQDPKQPSHVDDYGYFATMREATGPRPVDMSSLKVSLDSLLFDFDSVDWAATESLARAAIERTQIEGGRIEKITVERELTTDGDVTKSGSVRWTIEVTSSRENAKAYADPQGKITKLDLSHTARAANFHLYSPEAAREAMSRIDDAFGGRAKVMSLFVGDKSLGFYAQDPKTGKISNYLYDINGLSSSGPVDISDPEMEVRRLTKRHKLEDILFELDSIRLEQAPELGRRAIQRLGFENAQPISIGVKRDELGEGTKLVTFWTVACGSDRELGLVRYDLNGKELSMQGAKNRGLPMP